MVFPRIEKKGHGTGNAIEGAFARGEKVVLLDDLITTGKSKFEAVEILRDAGLVVTDLVVLLERGKGVRQELAAFGITLHSYFHVANFVETAFTMGIIGKDQKAEILKFLEEG
jgi:uridine monophosphate synthetase